MDTPEEVKDEKIPETPKDVDPGKVSEAAEDVDEEYEDEELTLVEKIIGVFTSPTATFKYLADRPDFWSAFFVIVLLAIALGLLAMPKMMPVQESIAIQATMKSFESAPMTEAEQTEAIETVGKMLPYIFYGQAVIGPIFALPIFWLITVMIIFFTALIQGLEIDFKRLMGTVPWLTFIYGLSSLASTARIMLSPTFTTEQLSDMRFMKPISAIMLVPKSIELPSFVVGLLSQIDPFFIWYVFVMVIALQAANRCRRDQAIVTTVVVNVLTLLAMAGVMVQQLKSLSQ